MLSNPKFTRGGQIIKLLITVRNARTFFLLAAVAKAPEILIILKVIQVVNISYCTQVFLKEKTAVSKLKTMKIHITSADALQH